MTKNFLSVLENGHQKLKDTYPIMQIIQYYQEMITNISQKHFKTLFKHFLFLHSLDLDCRMTPTLKLQCFVQWRIHFFFFLQTIFIDGVMKRKFSICAEWCLARNLSISRSNLFSKIPMTWFLKCSNVVLSSWLTTFIFKNRQFIYFRCIAENIYLF